MFALALGTAAPAVAAVQAGGFAPARVLDCSADRYACATNAYRAGHLTAARAAIDALLTDQPDDADALLLSGVIALGQNDLVGARVALDRAASVAPRYADVFVARARLNLREGLIQAAQQDFERVLALSPDHPDGDTLRRGLAGAALGTDAQGSAIWTAALDHSVSRLSPRAANAWYETRGTIARSRGATSIGLEVEHARRFERSDVRFQLRADQRLGTGSIYGAVLTTTRPDFRETWGLRAGGLSPISDRVDLLIDGRFSNYGRANSGSVTVGVRGWSAKRRTAIRLSLINFVDEAGYYRAGWAADLLRLVSSRVRIQAGYAQYPETEAGVTRQIGSAFTAASYQASDTLSFRIGLERESRQGTYRRDGATFGLSVGF